MKQRLLLALLPLLCGIARASDDHPEAAAHILSPVAARAPAQSPDDAHAPAAAPPEEPAPDRVAEERASLIRIGEAKLAAGDGDSALIAFRQVSTSPIDDKTRAVALLGLARAYRLTGQSVKAAATYEHLIQNHPGFIEIPSALLELGRTLRDLGGNRLALARFYSVIHSTLKLPEAETERYRRIVRTAQFEIAETHLTMGNYAEAVRFFERLNLLDLAAADRARARFKAAQCRLLAGDKTGAVRELSLCIAQDPDDINSPEARFLLAILFNELGRPADSLKVTLDLLTHEKAKADLTGVWQSWQRRTGNRLANQFYEKGEFHSASLLYRALDALSPEPAWRLPILYQLGLCLERLEQPAAAIEIYARIQTLAGENPSAALADIVRMALWRTEQIGWTTAARAEIQSLKSFDPPAPPEPAVPAVPAAPAVPSS
jgi:tetratricopeptide (TPR) repeat protein